MKEPVTISTDALYDDGALHRLLALTTATLAAARRSGRLRHTRQGQRTLYKGSWILEWLDSESTPAATGQEVTA